MDATGETRQGVRERLVEAAVRLLSEQGPAAVQTRQLAREVGASTMAVYHYFGGMPQLLAAVSDEGFRRLDASLGAVSASATEDPVTDIIRLALAYRVAARENPHLYDLMFGLSAPGGYRPKERELPDTGEPTPAERAYGHLVTAADRAVRAGRIREQDPVHVSAQLWSMLHGYLGLELAGHFTQLDGLTQVFVPLGMNLLVGLGDDPERVARSAARIESFEL